MTSGLTRWKRRFDRCSGCKARDPPDRRAGRPGPRLSPGGRRSYQGGQRVGRRGHSSAPGQGAMAHGTPGEGAKESLPPALRRLSISRSEGGEGGGEEETEPSRRSSFSTGGSKTARNLERALPPNEHPPTHVFALRRGCSGEVARTSTHKGLPCRLSLPGRVGESAPGNPGPNPPPFLPSPPLPSSGGHRLAGPRQERRLPRLGPVGLPDCQARLGPAARCFDEVLR